MALTSSMCVCVYGSVCVGVSVYTYFRSTYRAEKQVLSPLRSQLRLCVRLCVSSADLNAFSLSHYQRQRELEGGGMGDAPVYPAKGLWKALATPLAAIEKKLPLKAELKTLKWQPQAHTNEQICICSVRKTISVCITNLPSLLICKCRIGYRRIRRRSRSSAALKAFLTWKRETNKERDT